MDLNKEKQFGKGRGSILLKFLNEKEKSESAAQSQNTLGQSSSIEESEQRTQVQYHVPTLTEIPSSSTTGHGRASLLSKVKAMRFVEPPGSSNPVQVASQGRGSLMSKFKATRYVFQTINRCLNMYAY